MTTNESILSMLLAMFGCILGFQFWRISFYKKKLASTFKQEDSREQFSAASTLIENERSRISSDLHDELGSLLSVIFLDLQILTNEASSLTPQGESRLIEIQRNLNLVMESIRTNIWNLSAQMFDQLDLAFSLRELCHKLDRYKGTHVTFIQTGKPHEVGQDIKLNLFRITQELLTNSIKHSSAWNISVHLHWEEDQAISIIIEDDGMNYSQQKETNGIGMLSITKRANYINALIAREALTKGHRIFISLKRA
jgi:signal transduction histidine kinase